MTRTISEHQVRVYEFAKGRADKWFTIQDLSGHTNLPGGSAATHINRFEELGVIERMRISPANVFRLSASAMERDPELIQRLEEAIPIFADRKREWLLRETAAIGSIEAAPKGLGRLQSAKPIAPPGVQSAAGRAVRAREVHDLGQSEPVAPALPRVRKSDQLMSLLGRPEGASIDELIQELGTLPHSIRAQISVITRDRGVKAVLEDGRYYVR